MDGIKHDAAISIARQANSRDNERRVRIAIKELVLQGRTPSFYAVADAACVARSTLYRKADLKELVANARRASVEPSTMVEELKSLRWENTALLNELKGVSRERDELAAKLSRGLARNDGSRVSYWTCCLDISA